MSVGLLELRSITAKLDAREKALFEALVTHNRLLWLNLVSQNPLPAGRFDKTMLGSAIGSTDKYLQLFENTGSAPVGIAVYSLFTGAPGKQVKLSQSGDSSDEQVVDYLGNAATAPSFNKRISGSIVLPPKGKIYINTAATGFPLEATDKFSVRVFDPAAFLTQANWEARR